LRRFGCIVVVVAATKAAARVHGAGIVVEHRILLVVVLPSFFLSNQKQRFFLGAFGRCWNISRLITHTQRDSTENAMMMMMMMIQTWIRDTKRESTRGEKKRRMDGLCVSFFFSLGFFVAFLPTKNTTTRFDVVCSFLRVVPVRKRMCIVLCLPKAKRKTGD